jgi:hypothetical protein
MVWEYPLLKRLRERFTIKTEEEKEWKNIVELNHKFDTKTVGMKDTEGKEYTVEGIYAIRCYSGTEFIHLTLKTPGCYMRLLRPSNVKVEDTDTLRVSA